VYHQIRISRCSTRYRGEGLRLAGALRACTCTVSPVLFHHTSQDGSAHFAIYRGADLKLSCLPENDAHVGEVECHGISFQKIVAEHAGEAKTKLVFPRKRTVVEACDVLFCNFA
jgi:hypothetical protein